ncbi:MAG: glycosyltransferase family 39 protein [Dehalococcoidia bacterium]
MAASTNLHTMPGARILPKRLRAITKRDAAIACGLGAVVAIGAFLRFYELGANSIGNTYYAATVKSMLTSWHNFFFASFEPGGSVTVDKPPVGFWVQAASAYVFGVNGFALALPQALAGVLSIPLLFALVKRHFGVWAGLLAALVLATTPVTVATDRNNTIDGLLVFVLLLATWAVLKSVRGGQARFLLLGALLVGVGFNIKMIQAFAPLPAFYAVYLLAAPHIWWKRLVHLAAATVVLVVVSLSWAVAVDLTPPEDRPYVGSSEDNTVMELITGHNGISRLISTRGSPPSGADGPRVGDDAPPAFDRGLPPRPDGGPPPQFRDGPPPDGGLPPDGVPPAGGQPPADGPAGASNPFSFEVGEPGVLRLFTEPLVTEAGWLLPLALLAIPLVLSRLRWRWPLTDKHVAIVLWAGWLLPSLVYFSFTTGIFHAYYLIMLGPPIAALAGAAAWALRRTWQEQPWLGGALLVLLTGATIGFQVIALQKYPDYAGWVTAAAAILWVAGVGLLVLRPRSWLRIAGPSLLFLSLLAAPLVWSGATAADADPETSLPHSSPDAGQQARPSASDGLTPTQQATVDYLVANTDPNSYLVATLNAREAATYILETGRPVLTFGGFSGSDNVVDVDRLAQMIYDGELRFVLAGADMARSKPDIDRWIEANCALVTLALADGQDVPAGNQSTLYDCVVDADDAV